MPLLKAVEFNIVGVYRMINDLAHTLHLIYRTIFLYASDYTNHLIRRILFFIKIKPKLIASPEQGSAITLRFSTQQIAS
jgi:hypothetical protein